MLGWLRKALGASTPKQTRTMPATTRMVRARYDAAQTTADNQRHWAMADSLSARRANSPEVRSRLRNRARYEVANNSYARGILNSLAAWTVGTGPTLALQYSGVDSESSDIESIRDAARAVEKLWGDWFKSRQIAAKMFTMRLAMAQDGEAFGLLVSAPVFGDPIELDLRIIEADQVEDTSLMSFDNSGIVIDQAGRPRQYAVLPEHPGDGWMGMLSQESKWIDAAQILHLFRMERPGQLRGIPEITPALELFAQLRRFTLATLTAAETAADFAAIVSTEAPADDQDVATPWERLEIERGAMVSAPAGTRLSQFKAEHPNATYDEFVRSILREISRCLSVPSVIALGDASSYNYASGRLDLQTFQRQMEVDRSIIFEAGGLNKLWAAWLDEALLVEGYLPPEFISTVSEWKPTWRWPAQGHVDRQKEAAGQQAELANLTTTLQREYAKQGLDWEAELRQRAREIVLMAELGLSVQPAPGASPQQEPDPNDPNDQANEDQNQNNQNEVPA